MMNKFKNWLENNPVYGMCLFMAELCVIAFGGAYLGANINNTGDTYVVNLYGDDYIKQITNE